MAEQRYTGVRVVDFDVPFPRLVLLLVKLAIAAIPATIILAVIGAVFWWVVLSLIAAGSV